MKPEDLHSPPAPPPLSEGLAPDSIAPREPGIPFLKLLPTQRQTVIVLSPCWMGGITHFAQGRMKLHSENGCPYCKAGQKPRWYAWLHVLTPRTNREFLVQLASTQHGALHKHHATHGTLRGSELLLERRTKSPNTPTTATFLTPSDPGRSLPPAADLGTILGRQMEWTAGASGDHNHSSPPEGPGGKQPL